MSTTTGRRPFIAPLVDSAAQFIKERGAVTVDEIAKFLTAAGVNVRGDEELTGEQLAHLRSSEKFRTLPVIASGSTGFVRIIAALLVNRTVDLDAANPALAKLTWAGRWNAASRNRRSPTGGHYHVLTVRDPGGSEQLAECWEEEDGLGRTQQYLDEIVLSDSVDEGWDAIWIVGCGPDRCRRDEICNLPVEEWGAPHWLADTNPAFAVDDPDAGTWLDPDHHEPPF